MHGVLHSWHWGLISTVSLLPQSRIVDLPLDTLISAGMTLSAAGTSSGSIETFPCEDSVQASLPPVVQYQAAAFCLCHVSVCFEEFCRRYCL